jgi:hypothetical protein
MDCFASLAMTSKHTFAPRHAPEPLMNLPPKDGVGNAGCPLHPRPRVHLVLVERTRGPHRPALQPRCAPNAAASTASLPASVTIMIRPSCGVGWLESIKLFLPNGEAKYFSDRGWTMICPSAKSADAAA